MFVHLPEMIDMQCLTGCRLLESDLGSLLTFMRGERHAFQAVFNVLFTLFPNLRKPISDPFHCGSGTKHISLFVVELKTEGFHRVSYILIRVLALVLGILHCFKFAAYFL